MCSPLSQRLITPVLLRSTIQVSVLAILGIALGFLNQLVIAFLFGATPQRDAFFAAAIVPAYLAALFVGSVGSIFMASYVRHLTRNSPEELHQFASRTLNLYGLSTFGLAIVGMVFAEEIVAILAPGFSGVQLQLTADLLRVLLPSTAFMILSALLTTMYQAEGRFILPSVAPLVTIGVSMAVVILKGRALGIVSLAYGSLLGSICGFILLAPIAFRNRGYRFSLALDREVLSMFVVAAPLLLTGIVNRSTGIFERMIASGFDAGSVSYLGYANQFMNSLSGLAVSGIATTVFPLMSRYWELGDLPSLRTYFAKGIRFILLLTLPIVAIVVVMGESIVRILLERGAFDARATEAVSASLSVMMGAFVALSCGSLIAKGFYLSGKTRVFSVVMFAEIVVYLGVSVVLSSKLSYLGLAVALSVSSIFTAIVGIFLLRRIFGGLNGGALLRDSMRLTAAAAISGGVLYVMRSTIRWNVPEVVSTTSFGITGLIVYALLIGFVFRIDDIIPFRNGLLTRLGLRVRV